MQIRCSTRDGELAATEKGSENNGIRRRAKPSGRIYILRPPDAFKSQSNLLEARVGLSRSLQQLLPCGTHRGARATRAKHRTPIRLLLGSQGKTQGLAYQAQVLPQM